MGQRKRQGESPGTTAEMELKRPPKPRDAQSFDLHMTEWKLGVGSIRVRFLSFSIFFLRSVISFFLLKKKGGGTTTITVCAENLENKTKGIVNLRR